ncbi:hypothetical protein ScPMuIL_012346 [Solemya velum]
MKFVLLFTLFSITIYKSSSQLPETEKQYYACCGSHDGKVFLDADCPASMVIAINEVYVGTKPNFMGCPQETSNPFTELLELTCCSPDDVNDCIVPYSVKTYFHPVCTGKNVCPKLQTDNQPTSCEGGSFMTNSNYMYMDYYCIPEIKIGQFDNAAISFGSSVMCYLQSAGYPVSAISGGSSHACSVETDCLETVTTSLIDIRLMNSTDICQQRLTITDGSSTHIISCTENNDYVINKEYYYSQGNYLRLELKSSLATDDGYVWIGIQASGSVSIQCPAKAIQNPCTPTTTTTNTTTGDSTIPGSQVLDSTEPGTTEDKSKTSSGTTATPATVEPGIGAGTIAGIVVAVFGIITVGILVCLCCVYKTKKQKKSEEKTTKTVQESKPQSALTVSGLKFDTEAPKLQSGLLGSHGLTNERFKVSNAPLNVRSSLPPIGTKMIPTNDQHSAQGGVSPSPLLRLSKLNETGLAPIDKPIPTIKASISSEKQLTPPIETNPWNVNQRHSQLEATLSHTKQLRGSETNTGLPTTKQRTPSRLANEDTDGTDNFNWGLTTQKFATGKLPDRGSDSSPWDSDDPSLSTTTYHAKSLGVDGIIPLRHGTSNIGFEGLKHKTDHVKSRVLDDRSKYSENVSPRVPNTPPEIEANAIMSSVGTTVNSTNTITPLSMKSLVGRDPSTKIVMDHSEYTQSSGFEIHPNPVFRPLRDYPNNIDEDSHLHNDPIKEQLVDGEHAKHKKKKKKRRILQKEEIRDDSKLDINNGYQHTSRNHSKHKKMKHENITSTQDEGEKGAAINTPTVLFVQEAASSKRKKQRKHKSHNKQIGDFTSAVKHIADEEEDDRAHRKKGKKHGTKKSKHRDKQEEYSGIDTNVSSFDKTWSAIETGNTWSSDDNNYTTGYVLYTKTDKGFSQLPETEKQYYACYGSHDGKIFLDADCPASMVIAIKEVYVGTKPNFLGCPQETSKIKIGQFDNAAISFGSSVMCYLQSAGYPVSKISGGSTHTCSVETDCLETVTISLIDIRLMDSAVTCEQRLTITDGSSAHIISCTENNDYVINKEYYYSQGNYLRLELKSTLTTDDGYIWIGIQASGSVSIQCPAKVIQNPCTPTTTTTTTTTITGDSTTSGQQVLDTTEPGTTEDKPKTQSRTTVTPATVEPGIEAGTIAGIVVAVFGIIIVGILICLCCVYKKKKQKKSEEKTTITVQGSKPQSALTVSGLTFDTEAPKLQSGLLGSHGLTNERFKVSNAPVNVRSSLPPIGTKMIPTNGQHSTQGGVSPSPLLRLSKPSETSLAPIDKPIPTIRVSLSSDKQLTPPIETNPWNVNQRHSLLETKLSPTKQPSWLETSTDLATTKQRTPFRLADEDTDGTESFNSGLATQKFVTGKLPDRGSDSSPWDSDDPSLATTTYHAKSLGVDGITSLRHGTRNIGFEGLKHETNHIKSRFPDDKNQYFENTYSHFPDTQPAIEADNIMSSVGTTDRFAVSIVKIQ